MSNKSGNSEQIISLPKGGGALQGIGETFSPDLFTGTGNFTVPIAIPSGRNGFQPELNLVYSTGNGNSPFGLGWSLSVPGISRKTSKGVPRYRDHSRDVKEWDTFVLSGAEDLVPIALWRIRNDDPDDLEMIENPTDEDFETAEVVQFRPRTEGLFALIFYYRTRDHSYWKVQSKDGLTSYYGTSFQNEAGESEHVTIADPKDRTRIFAWKLTETRDPFGNRILYEYQRDMDQSFEYPPQHHWDQLYLHTIKYVDYDDGTGGEKFLVSITFDCENENRPDAFSAFRSGFEIRTRKRYHSIWIKTHPTKEDLAKHYALAEDDPNFKDYILVREYRLEYVNDPLNGVSLLSKIEVIGHDEAVGKTESLPPLTFGYSTFDPEGRDFFPIEGMELPAGSLANDDMNGLFNGK